MNLRLDHYQIQTWCFGSALDLPQGGARQGLCAFHPLCNVILGGGSVARPGRPLSQPVFSNHLTLPLVDAGVRLRVPQPLELNEKTTFDNGSLGSRNDEERSEMRYVM